MTQQFPDTDQSLIEELIQLGYTEDDIKTILEALELNAVNAGYKPTDKGWLPYRNRALTGIIQRFKDALNNGQYDALLKASYTQDEIRNILFTNLMPTTQVLARTAEARASGEYDRLHQLGYTDKQIRSLIRAGLTVSQLRALADRVNDAQRYGVDAQGLTIEQINDMVFKDRPINGKDTLGIATALLSGLASNTREGEVARSIIDYATMFDIPYGPNGANGQVDVGTRHIIIEAKVDRVTGGSNTFQQIQGTMTNTVMNPPDANGRRKFVILYAPSYKDAPAASIQAIGGYVVKSCEQLREQIRQLGGP